MRATNIVTGLCRVIYKVNVLPCSVGDDMSPRGYSDSEDPDGFPTLLPTVFNRGEIIRNEWTSCKKRHRAMMGAVQLHEIQVPTMLFESDAPLYFADPSEEGNKILTHTPSLLPLL